MNTKAYSPMEGSPAWKVLEFFRANPDEQLDADLVAAKCDCDRRSVHSLLGPAVQAGLLHREEDRKSGELVYRLPDTTKSPSGFHAWLERRGEGSAEGRTQPGRRSARATAQAPAPAEDSGTPPVAAARPRSAPFHADLSAIKLDKNVPIPGRGSKPLDWTALLSRMDVGDSFPLPANARSAVSTAMKAFKEATGRELTCRRVDDGIRVWRLS